MTHLFFFLFFYSKSTLNIIYIMLNDLVLSEDEVDAVRVYTSRDNNTAGRSRWMDKS